MIKVTDLYYYPIKSCAGWRVDSAELTATGLANDRMMLITKPDGQFVTQRQHPKMALIQPTISGNQLTLNAPGMQVLTFNVEHGGDCQPVTIWGSTVDAVNQGKGVNQWISDYLKADLQLVAMHKDARRSIDPNFKRNENDVVSFADGYAALVISQESLDHLNSKLAEPVGMDRFRPNIVISGTGSHSEDRWKELRIGDIAMSGAKPCARCAIPAIDQQTGTPGKEPNTTLASYRKFPNGVMFGMNMIHHNTGTISINDEVEIIEEHHPSWIGLEDHTI